MIGCGFDDTPPSDNVVPPLAQVRMVSTGKGPLGFRSGGLAGGYALSAALGRLLYKSRLRLLPLYTATVVRCVVSPANTALWLFPRGKARTEKLWALSSDASGRLSAITLRVA